MKNVPETELLSAYLDGELTADEQAEVERLLTASPTARQLLEEFRTLSSTLQNLPTNKLAEDISQRVLRLAERRMLSEPAEQPPGDEPTRTVARPWRATVRRVLSPRGLAWSAVAVAVAVVLLIMDPGRFEHPADREVAMAPQMPEEPGVASSIGAAPGAAEQNDADDRFSAAREADEEHNVAEAEEKVSAAVPKATPAPPPARTMAAKAPLAPRSETSESARNVAADKSEVPFAEAARPDTRRLPGGGGRRAVASGGDGARLHAAGSVKLKGSASARSAEAALPAPTERFQYTAKLADDVLTVHCDVTAKAARDGMFRQLLTRRKIVPIAPPAENRPLAEAAAGYARGGKGRRAMPAVTTDRSGDPTSTPAAARVELEATAAQVEAVLAELCKRPKAFLSVRVVPAAGVEGIESLTRYNRPYKSHKEPLESVRQLDVRETDREAGAARLAAKKDQPARRAARAEALPPPAGSVSSAVGGGGRVAKAGTVSSADAASAPPAGVAGGQAFRGFTPPSPLGHRGLRIRAEVMEEAAKPGADRKPAGAEQKNGKSRLTAGDTHRPKSRMASGTPEGKPATYRVLFVLRVVSPSAPVAAVSVKEEPSARKASLQPPKAAAARADPPVEAPAAATPTAKP